MSSEIRVNSSLQVSNANCNYRSAVSAYVADQSGKGGPTPGTLVVPVTGVNVDLSQLTTPGLCEIINQDSTNYIIYGLYDSSKFRPIGELLPGENVVLRLWRYLGVDYGTGTGTTGHPEHLHLMAMVASCRVFVGAFER